LKKYIIEQNLGTESELKSIEKKIDDVVEEAVEFADAKGFGIGPDGKYRCEDPKFTQGTAQV
jgi:pyruvate dehydrogenase E1 component alpha subunit